MEKCIDQEKERKSGMVPSSCTHIAGQHQKTRKQDQLIESSVGLIKKYLKNKSMNFMDFSSFLAVAIASQGQKAFLLPKHKLLCSCLTFISLFLNTRKSVLMGKDLPVELHYRRGVFSLTRDACLAASAKKVPHPDKWISRCVLLIVM